MAAVAVTNISKTATLTAATEDRVTVSGKFRRIDITNLDASGFLSVTQNATATVDGDDSRPVPPGTTRTLYDDAGTGAVAVSFEDADLVFGVISAAACKYCVEVY